MAELYTQGIRQAKATLEGWFAGPHGERLFLPETDVGVSVTRKQERAVRAALEPRLTKAHRELELITAVTVAIIFLPLAVSFLELVALPFWLLIGPFLAGTAFLTWCGLRNDRTVRDLREATAMALREQHGAKPTVERRKALDPQHLKNLLLGTIAAASLSPLLVVPLKGSLPPSGGWLIDLVPGLLIGVAIGVIACLWLVERARRRG